MPRLKAYQFLLALLVCVGGWTWIRAVFIPANTAEAHAAGRPIGNNSDLYPRWLGARELLLHGRDPYSVEVSREIQIGYYGRQLDARRSSDPADQAGFAYPIYAALLLAPAVKLDFAAVQRGSGWLLLACAAVSVPLWVRGLRLRAPTLTWIGLILLLFATYPLIQAYYLRQLTLLLALLLSGCIACVAGGQLIFAGVLLALATIKPQLAAPLILVMGIWVWGNWRERRRLAWSFAASMIVLVAAGEVLLWGWIGRFLAAARAYQRYAGDPSLLQVLFGTTGGVAISILLAVGVAALAWKRRHESLDPDGFGFVIGAALTVDVLVLPKLAPYNQVVLVPALILLWDRRKQLLSGDAMRRALYRATAACLIWQWLAALALAIASLVIPAQTIGKLSGAPLYTIYALPVVLGLLLLVIGVQGVHHSRTVPREAARA